MGGEGTAAAPGAVGPARLFSFLFQLFSFWISFRLRLLPRHTYTRDRRGFGDPAHPGSSTAARCPAPEMSHMHLSDKKSEIAKLGTEGARLGVSCPREQATPKEESLVEVPRFVGGGRGTGRGSGFGGSHLAPAPGPESTLCRGRPVPLRTPVPASGARLPEQPGGGAAGLQHGRLRFLRRLQ